MKRRFASVLLAGLLLMVAQSVMAADKKPLIADPVVEQAIRSPFCLKKPAGELTKADLKKVTGLRLERSGITDEGLKEVAKLEHLSKLYLRDTRITDL
ncbi:MAG: hypothetical protein VB875_08200, partial [Pirellulales bacterium]